MYVCFNEYYVNQMLSRVRMRPLCLTIVKRVTGLIIENVGNYLRLDPDHMSGMKILSVMRRILRITIYKDFIEASY